MKTLKNLFASYGKKLEKMFKRQTRVFANFVNSRIGQFDQEIKDVKELSTGVGFFYLLKAMVDEDTSIRPLQGMNFKSKNAIIKMSNCNILMKFLREDQGMPLHGINAQAISQGDEKTILGLLWSLISKYQVGDGSDDNQVGKNYFEMMRWVNSKVPEEHNVDQVDNWSTGQTLYHLINAVLQHHDITEHFELPDVENMNPMELVEKCIDFSYDRMDIPKLIQADDMCVEPDELTIMTYISYFKNMYVTGLPGKKKKPKKEEIIEEEVEEPPKPKREIGKQIFTLTKKEFGTFKAEMAKKGGTFKKEGEFKPFKAMYEGERVPVYVKDTEVQVGNSDDCKIRIPFQNIMDIRQEQKKSAKSGKENVVIKITEGEECGGNVHKFKFRKHVGEDFEIELMKNLKIGEEELNSGLFDAWYLGKHRKVEPTEKDGFMIYAGGVTADKTIKNIRYEDMTRFENYVYKDKVVYYITKKWKKKYELTFYERTKEFEEILLRYIHRNRKKK